MPAGVRLQKRAWLPSGVCDGPDEMRKLVRTLLMAGADSQDLHDRRDHLADRQLGRAAIRRR